MQLRKFLIGLSVFAALAGATGSGLVAQAPAVGTGSSTPATNVTSDVRVEVVLSRRQGQKVISSRPFELIVTPNQRAQLRQGIDVYVSEKESRFIGTNIDVMLRASGPSGAPYSLQVSINDSTLADGSENRPIQQSFVQAIRTYSASGTFVVRDGQTILMSLGTDPTSAEVTRAEVTVRVAK